MAKQPAWPGAGRPRHARRPANSTAASSPARFRQGEIETDPALAFEPSPTGRTRPRGASSEPRRSLHSPAQRRARNADCRPDPRLSGRPAAPAMPSASMCRPACWPCCDLKAGYAVEGITKRRALLDGWRRRARIGLEDYLCFRTAGAGPVAVAAVGPHGGQVSISLGSVPHLGLRNAKSRETGGGIEKATAAFRRRPRGHLESQQGGWRRIPFRADFGNVTVALADRGRRRTAVRLSTRPAAAPCADRLRPVAEEVARRPRLVHVGARHTGGQPGKTVASRNRFPRSSPNPLPVIYPFIVSNPGEAAQAKRRIAAVTWYLPPPLAGPDWTKPSTGPALVDEYAQADGSTATARPPGKADRRDREDRPCRRSRYHRDRRA